MPRLSLATVSDLREALLCILDPAAKGLGSAYSVEEVVAAHSRGELDLLAAAHQTVKTCFCTASGQLRPAGQLVQLEPPGNNCTPHFVRPECFDELLVVPGMVSSHLPYKYLAAVRAAVADSETGHV